MARRKHIHHGSKRKASKSFTFVAADGAACVTRSIDVSDADLIKIVTVASDCGVQLTVNLTDIYEGQVVYIDFTSGDASDCLVVTLNGTACSVDEPSGLTAGNRGIGRVVVLDVDSGSEQGSHIIENADI